MFNFKTVQFEDVWDENFINFYSIFMDISLALNLIFIIPVFYIVLTQSRKEMAATKYYFCLSFSADIIFDICMGLFKPFPLFPIWLGKVLGLTKSLGDDFAYWTFEAMELCFALIMMAQIFLQCYRYTAILPWEFMRKAFGSFPTTPIIFTCSFLVVFGLPVSILHMSRIDTNDFKQHLINESNFPPSFFENQAIVAYDETLNSAVLIFIYYVVCLCPLLIIAMIVLILAYDSILKLNKVNYSQQTIAMQRQLHRALTTSFLFFLIFCMLPTFISFLYVAFRFPYGNYVTISLFSISTFHTIADGSAVIYFIKPYRDYVKRFFPKCFPIFKVHHVAPSSNLIGLVHNS